jgi:uncharacterized membrane-anchored protein
MRFSRFVFIAAGVWGVVVLAPLFFLFDISGRQYAAPTSYPQFFYGFVAVALAWQIAFFVIGSDPVRFRPVMIPAILEKLGFVITALVFYVRGRISNVDVSAAWPDLILGCLFIVAFFKARR